MRLKELERAERSFLIFNGWCAYKVRDQEHWFHPEHCPKDNGIYLTQDDAVRYQKARDRGLTAIAERRRHPMPDMSPEETAPDTQPSGADGLCLHSSEPPVKHDE